jgi:hypothetical protein
MSPRKKILLIALVVILLAIGGYFLWAKVLNKSSGNPGGQTEETIQAEKETTEAFNKELEEKKESGGSASTPSNKKPANTVLAYISATEARGYVSNVLEDGGTCTITFTKGSEKVTATSTGLIDVSKTTCRPITINPGQLGSGEWSAVLSYSSATSEGSSEAQVVKVP